MEAAEKEWELFREERETGISDIHQLRQRVAEEEARRKTEKGPENDEMDTDAAPAPAPPSEDVPGGEAVAEAPAMDVDNSTGAPVEEHAPEPEKKEEPVSMQADDDDAVEY